MGALCEDIHGGFRDWIVESPAESLPQGEYNRLCVPLEQGGICKSAELGTSGRIYFEMKTFLQ